ncbi:acyl-CoA dehydratase activase-related protein [Fonticella tunisiensis]|uniref:Putative nucleotide-binding protein (Sugar kinase/HSP70/actin superfamily) n=1 Tax=Fonticella tunisiensis TaxID=1096341 RepID=A0A4R7KPL2_9CLOT|nr:acyl-CoA dehydratase activase-related protein [Fonticella tunisiensis]TDT60945.1 putative nucleotide-binding protein (sugar kinase/HSP70/actin superfamily) [Fonticella tunisiensis]
MIVGIPKGLLYYKYNPFFETFFNELGAETLHSMDTSKNILDDGVKYCVDEACLPVKIFHGHVVNLRGKCDLILIPRIMRIRKREFICPKFCGLPEMVINSIPDLPLVTRTPIYADSPKRLYEWAEEVGRAITSSRRRIEKAFELAINRQREYKHGIKDEGFKINIALVGHPYNIYDNYVNMNLVKKLNNLGVGVITEENIDDRFIDEEVARLFKRPFWTFARNSYGFASHMARNKKVNGIIYISSFACGIDSVITELIKQNIPDIPLLVLKIDEHTGEAGFDTRIEAFTDMLERRC